MNAELEDIAAEIEFDKQQEAAARQKVADEIKSGTHSGKRYLLRSEGTEVRHTLMGFYENPEQVARSMGLGNYLWGLSDDLLKRDDVIFEDYCDDDDDDDDDDDLDYLDDEDAGITAPIAENSPTLEECESDDEDD